MTTGDPICPRCGAYKQQCVCGSERVVRTTKGGDMATLLRLKPAGAKRAHTCDARCYNAKGTDCHCFCKGQNHGRGFEFAVDNIVKNMPTFQALGCTLAKAIEDAVRILKGNVQ